MIAAQLAERFDAQRLTRLADGLAIAIAASVRVSPDATTFPGLVRDLKQSV